jgi:hypothetical protein
MQNMFHPLFGSFWRENIGDNKKDITFLLVWDKDSYTERFMALLPWTCILKPTLIHLCQTTSLLPCPLLTMAFANLTLLYLLLNLIDVLWAHQPHSNLRFPSLSLFLLCAFSP